MYFRLRNTGAIYTYTITITSDDIVGPESNDYSIKELVTMSPGSLLDYSASHVFDGQAVIKVTLPSNGAYLQFNQKLTDLVGGNATVKITAGANTRSDYETARFALQLTADGAASTDIVPVDERTVDPGTDGITWSFAGSSNVMYVGKGSRWNAAFDNSINNKLVPNKGVSLRYVLNEDGTVTYVHTYNPYNPSTPEASTKTLTDINGTEGLYFRLRNTGAIYTYTITITSEDIVALEVKGGAETSYDGEYKDYLYVSENGVVDETETNITSGEATLKVTVAPGGYFQYLQKITDFFGGIGAVSVKLGEHQKEDYTTADFSLQLTTDAAAKTDITPLDEAVYIPDSRAVSFKVLTSGHMWIGSGANTRGGTTYTLGARIFGQDNNDCSNGINLRFQKDENGYIQARNTRDDLIKHNVAGIYTSRQTFEKVRAQDGLYVRIRNDKTTAVTFTVTIISTDIHPLISSAYKDGKWIFSSEETTKVSTKSNNSNGIFTEELTAKIAPNGYVQLDKKLSYLISNKNAKITIQVGDGSVAVYEAARFYVQLTADEKAETDIIPVDERTYNPGVKGMTWRFEGGSGKMWTGRGNTTLNGGFYGSTDAIANTHDGMHIAFNYEGDKVAYCPTDKGLNYSGTLPSTRSISDIGGSDGVYFRLCNAASKTVQFTVIVQYTEGVIEGKPVTQKGWTVKGETEEGVEIEDEKYEVSPGYRAWNFTIPENTYAQFNTKITDLKDANICFDTSEYNLTGFRTSFAFVLDENADWDPKSPDGNIKKFTIYINPSSDPENVHIALSTGSVVPGMSNATPTLRALQTSDTHKGQGGFDISFVYREGHWYLSVSGIVLNDSVTLEPYLRMDEFVEKGAFFRFYAESNGESTMYPQVSISSAVVPPASTDEDESAISEDEKMLNEFLDYFTDNIDAVRKADMTVVNKLAEMWNALSYLNQSNVEAYFIDEEEVYNLIQALKSYALSEGAEEEYDWITTYTTVYTTTTITHNDGNLSKRPQGGDNFPIEIVIAIAASALVVVAGGVTFIIIRKKRKVKSDVSE